MKDSKHYFEAWWSSGVHGWNPTERLSEYVLAQDAFLAGVNFACDKIEEAPQKIKEEKSNRTQQLKAEIAALADEVYQMSLLHPSEQSFSDIVDRMRQLSAV